MSQLQYIGARYVPIWYVNSDDQSANWQSNVEYEPLTFVTDINNHLYLSKKTVPDTIGDPANNIEYWLDMGLFTNAQIAALQDQVNNIEDNIIPGIQDDITDITNTLGDDDLYARLHNKKIIVLGDSIESGAGSAVGHTWVEQMASKYGCTMVNAGVSGSPIGNTSYPDSYISRIDALLASNDTCDYFIIAGGANDKNRGNRPGSTNTSDTSTLSGALKTIINKVKTKYGKTCQIRTMTQLHRYNDHNAIGYNEFDYVDAMMRASAICSVPCFDRYNNCGFTLLEDEGIANRWCDAGYVDSGTRNFHPSIDAYAYMMPNLAAFIAFGCTTIPTKYPNYYSSGNKFIEKTILGDGHAQVAYHDTVSVTFNDLGNHLFGMSDISVSIPEELGLAWINTVNVTLNCQSWTLCGSVKYLNPPSGTDNHFTLSISGMGTYGSTPPTTENVFVSVVVTGY